MINGFNIGIILLLVGLYGIVTNKNVIKIVMSIGIMGNGVVLFFISLGYVTDGGAPIMVAGVENIVDPLPQALMLTMIVINLCLTALALTIVVWLYNEFGTLDLGEMR
ncbi:MAG: sodium:proton antiporter [Thermoplasmatota archaeon]|jgi:multicomponent Na+:H+ antiporter subunit C